MRKTCSNYFLSQTQAKRKAGDSLEQKVPVLVFRRKLKNRGVPNWVGNEKQFPTVTIEFERQETNRDNF